MIYVTYRYDELLESSSIKNIWNVKYSDVKKRYTDFLLLEAEKRNIIINNHWYNIMTKDMFHDHLSEDEYILKEKEWNKFLRQWDIDKFIAEKLKGQKLKYTNL